MDSRSGALIGLVVATAALAFGAGLAASGNGTIRILLAVCAVAMFGIATIYLAGGYTKQTVGHAVAGLGFAIAAGVGDGLGVWVGVALAGVGGVLLVRDALRQGGRGRPSA